MTSKEKREITMLKLAWIQAIATVVGVFVTAGGILVALIRH